MSKKISMEEIVSFCKTNGFVFQGSEIYGGLANTWDYGPLGVELKNNIKKCWWKKFVQEEFNNVGLDASILMNPKVWLASGHLGGFSDPLTDCRKCNTRHRADKLIEDFDGTIADGFSKDDLLAYLVDHNIACPKCGAVDYTPIREFDLMFKTTQGVVDDEGATVYFRPETAQGVFVNYKNVQRSMRKKLPFGIGQIGKSFRNEITPGNFIFRTREFEQMEMEFFCKPGTELEWYEYYKNFCYEWLIGLGVNADNVRVREHAEEELSHYSNGTVDLEYKFPFGYGELWGIASRTNFDLNAHQNMSKENLEYLDPDTNEKYIPYVIEPSVGVERLFLTFLADAYQEEELEGETRQVLKLHHALAPYKVTVLPLIKKIHQDKAIEVYKLLSQNFSTSYDEAGKIGKRYRRQDSIGTPFCITIDDNSLNQNEVTIRFRDSMDQVTVSIDDLVNYLQKEMKY